MFIFTVNYKKVIRSNKIFIVFMLSPLAWPVFLRSSKAGAI